ncbi:MAG: hypothetical protein ACYSUB_02045 [Planctomycetota bacterium]|jgi:hypothetical protein
MLTFLLGLVDEGVVVSRADSPDELDFDNVAGQTRFEVRARFWEMPNEGGSIHPVAAVDLTGYEDLSDWVVDQIKEEINFRMALPDFEGEVKRADGPLIAFGEPNIGPDGFII